MTTPLLTSYLSLYARYYDLERPTIDPYELALYAFYAGQTIGPILEPMCGTGRLLIPLMQAGYAVYGFDASPYMVTALKEKSARAGLVPNVWVTTLQTFTSSLQYQLILIPDGSFSLITGSNEIIQALRALYSALQPGGTLVMEVQTPYFTPQQSGVWTSRAVHLPEGGMIYAHNLNVSLQENVGSSVSRYELIDAKSQVVTTEFERYSLRFYEPYDLQELLHAVGFEYVHFYKPYNPHDTVIGQAEYVIVECRKNISPPSP